MSIGTPIAVTLEPVTGPNGELTGGLLRLPDGTVYYITGAEPVDRHDKPNDTPYVYLYRSEDGSCWRIHPSDGATVRVVPYKFHSMHHLDAAAIEALAIGVHYPPECTVLKLAGAAFIAPRRWTPETLAAAAQQAWPDAWAEFAPTTS
ncbi:MAG TPA: hypothetical protein VMT30_08575 [Candidatus Saccharimonadia bacterium]|nr:hypothetical protein [Candidatus Saccharimonadia bacterium]